MALTPGTRIGPYEITALLGRGGMGEVYRARDTKLRRDIAIKVLPASFALDADRLQRFEREAQLLATLNHPHIGTIYGFQEADCLCALALELIDGPTLADRLQSSALPVEEALEIARQIADALETAHDRGIVHRDLKPANIILEGAWDGVRARTRSTSDARATGAINVKVVDFGLAKVGPGEAAAVALTNSPTFTVGPTG